jgi:1-acyl-sn-glycerol-3-phosphate acyltransferase
MSNWDFKPAADTGLNPIERATSTKREGGLISRLGVTFSTTISLTYLKLYHRYAVEGREHLPTDTPFVLCANHSSHLDHAMLRNALPLALRVRTMPLAAGDVFFSSPVRAGLSGVFVNSLPVWRKKVTAHAMNDLRERLSLRQTGFVLFPEGARTRDGNLLRFKAGIGMLVAGLDVPVIPAWLDGAFQALPPGRVLPRPVKLIARFGPALRFSDLPNEREGWEQVVSRIEASVRALGNQPAPTTPASAEA